jgi:YidC/Oxa1 family membrane protein insertase
MMLVTANIFQPLIDVFESVLKAFHSTGLSWGWSIVLLTVAVRAVLVPLTFRQIKGMVRMQSLQPQMKAIQQKYKADKPRQQQEIMAFYKENNVNPLASCLPMVLQLPVFISLYYMLRKNLRNDICPAVQHKFQLAYAHAHHTSFAKAAGQTAACGSHPASHFLFISEGDRDRARGPDPALHRVPDQLDARDVGRLDDGPDAAEDHALHAADLRAVRDPLPRRPDALLDHDEPVDRRPAVLSPPVHRPIGGGRRWRIGRRRRQRLVGQARVRQAEQRRWKPRLGFGWWRPGRAHA